MDKNRTQKDRPPATSSGVRSASLANLSGPAAPARLLRKTRRADPRAPRSAADARAVAMMATVAASLVVMSSVHLAGILNDGRKPFDSTDAGVAEAVICAVLVSGLITAVRTRAGGWRASVYAVGFAIVGFIVGLTLSLSGGAVIDAAYHATFLLVLVAAMVLLVRVRVRRATAPGSAD